MEEEDFDAINTLTHSSNHFDYDGVTNRDDEEELTKEELSDNSLQVAKSDSVATALPTFQPFKLQLNGFAAINRLLKKCCPGNACLVVNGSTRESDWIPSQNNPWFQWENDPLPGWKRIVKVRISGKTMGDTEVAYIPPGMSKHLRSRHELASYLQRNSLSVGLLNRFDFRIPYCVCFQPHDGSNRQYIECSLGLTGCRGWIHSECVNLGVLNAGAISELSKVICPLCTAYLEGSEMIDEYPEDMKLREITIQFQSQIEIINEVEILQSSQHHHVWGIIGNNQFSYDDRSTPGKLTNSSKARRAVNTGTGITRLPTATALSENIAKRQRGGGKKMNPSRIENTSATASNHSDAPSLISNPVAAGISLAIFQHRLFAGISLFPWAKTSYSSTRTGKLNSSNPAAPTPMTGVANAIKIISSPMTIPKSLSVDENSNIQNYNQLESESDIEIEFDPTVEPRDRWRYAREAGRKRIKIRVTGGWMCPASNNGTSRSNNCNKKSAALHSRDLKSKLAFDIIKEQDLLRDRVLQHARVAEADPMLVHLRYKQNLIDSLVNSAQALMTRKKAMSKSGALRTVEDYFGDNSEMALVFDTQSYGLKNDALQNHVLDAYFEPPLLSYIPLEDGGLRMGCASASCVSKSLHGLCAAAMWCGVCFTSIPAEHRFMKGDGDRIKSSTKKKSYKRKIRCMDDINWEDLDLDGDNSGHIVPLALGDIVSYRIHRQCHFALSVGSGGLLDSIERYGSIQLTTMYHYEAIDDAECDLCGRTGGVMHYFNINPKNTSVRAPSADGWLGHFPCIFWIASSRLLIPLSFDVVATTPVESYDVNTVRVDNLNYEMVTHQLSDSFPDDSPARAEMNNERRVSDQIDDTSINFESLNSDTHASPIMNDTFVNRVPVAVTLDDIIVESNEQIDVNSSMSLALLSDEGDSCVDIDLVQQATKNEDAFVNAYDSSLSARHLINYNDLVEIPSTLQSLEAAETKKQLTTEVKEFINGDGLNYPSVAVSEGIAVEIPAKTSLSNTSRFDSQFNAHRCVLCGLHAGICIRCCAIACNVRVHPLCCTIASAQGWVIGSLDNVLLDDCHAREIDSASKEIVMTCLCPIHSQKN